MRYQVVAALFAVLCAQVVGAPPARAVPVDGLYEALVEGNSTESGRAAAAADALRQVVVRVTGRSAAATDPVLQGMYEGATRWVQTYRTTAPGQVAVIFDQTLVEAGLTKAGQHLWGRDRPRILAVVEATAEIVPALRRDLQGAALLRGVPLAFPETDTEPPPDVREGRPGALESLAKAFGADGVLLVRATPVATSAAWWAPGGYGTAEGSAVEVFSQLADRMGAAQSLAVAENARHRVVVHGVHDLASLVSATRALGALPSVSAVSLESLVASTAKLRLTGPADSTALKKAAQDSGHFAVGDAGGSRDVDLVYRP